MERSLSRELRFTVNRVPIQAPAALILYVPLKASMGQPSFDDLLATD
jgi:hypothetical protein